MQDDSTRRVRIRSGLPHGQRHGALGSAADADPREAGSANRVLSAPIEDHPPEALAIPLGLEHEGLEHVGVEHEGLEHVGVADHVAIDAETLLELRSFGDAGQPEVFRDLLLLFLQGADQLLASMRQAVAEDSSELLARSAHALKGSAGVLGATMLQLGCLHLELLARRGELASAAALVEAAAREIQLVRAQIESEELREVPSAGGV